MTHYLHYDDRNGANVDQANVARMDSASPAITNLGTIQSSAGIVGQSGVATGRSRCASPADATANADAHASLAEFARMAANVASHPKAIGGSSVGKSSTAGRKCTNCGNTQTRQWVRGEGQAWLCHSCGQFWRKNGYSRPRTLWNRPTFKRSSRKVKNDTSKSPEDRRKKVRSFKAKKETVSSNFLNGKKLVECEERLPPLLVPGRANTAGRAVVLGTRTLMVGGGHNAGVGCNDGSNNSGVIVRGEVGTRDQRQENRNAGDIMKSEIVDGFHMATDHEQGATHGHENAFHEAISWDGSYTRSVDNSRLPSTSSLGHGGRADVDGDGGGGSGGGGGCSG